MNKKRILIIDDEVGFTRLLQLSLGWTGRYTVRVENQPKSALAVVREFRPDLILLDVMMPGMDGGDIAAELQRHPDTSGIPVLFVTAAVRKEEVASHEGRIGGAEYIAKPVEGEELLERIDRGLGLTHIDSGEFAPAAAGKG